MTWTNPVQQLFLIKVFCITFHPDLSVDVDEGGREKKNHVKTGGNRSTSSKEDASSMLYRIGRKEKKKNTHEGFSTLSVYNTNTQILKTLLIML